MHSCQPLWALAYSSKAHFVHERLIVCISAFLRTRQASRADSGTWL